MPKKAYRVEDDGLLTEVEASKLTKNDYFKNYICINCGRPMYLRGVGSSYVEPHFYGSHSSDCTCSGLSTKKISNHIYVYCPDKAASFIDREASVTLIKESENASKSSSDSDEIIDKDDYKEIVTSEVIDSVRKVYDLANREPNAFESFGVDLNMLYFNPKNSQYFRENGINGQVMVELRKCSPDSLNPSVPKINYFFCLVEVGATNYRKAVYFNCRLRNQNRNIWFWNKLAKMSEHEIVVLWTNKCKRIEDDNYVVYVADNLTSKEIAIVKRRNI